MAETDPHRSLQQIGLPGDEFGVPVNSTGGLLTQLLLTAASAKRSRDDLNHAVLQLCSLKWWSARELADYLLGDESLFRVIEESTDWLLEYKLIQQQWHESMDDIHSHWKFGLEKRDPVQDRPC